MNKSLEKMIVASSLLSVSFIGFAPLYSNWLTWDEVDGTVFSFVGKVFLYIFFFTLVLNIFVLTEDIFSRMIILLARSLNAISLIPLVYLVIVYVSDFKLISRNSEIQDSYFPLVLISSVLIILWFFMNIICFEKKQTIKVEYKIFVNLIGAALVLGINLVFIALISGMFD
ncbi:MAG: hypothetical protein LBM27_00815 [Lactobacillaceae bacterium]|nr:hypothetical protein [Lactobacillaceae bacterium]